MAPEDTTAVETVAKGSSEVQKLTRCTIKWQYRRRAALFDRVLKLCFRTLAVESLGSKDLEAPKVTEYTILLGSERYSDRIR